MMPLINIRIENEKLVNMLASNFLKFNYQFNVYSNNHVFLILNQFLAPRMLRKLSIDQS